MSVTISKEELAEWLARWALKPTDGARVLCIQKSKMSEYLSGERAVPPYVAAHIETFDQLAENKATKVIQKRLAIVPIGNYSKTSNH